MSGMRRVLKFTNFMTYAEYFSIPLNANTILLIHKSCSPTKMDDYHPTSLWNCIYKVTSFTCVQRTRPLVSKCISSHQVAFILDRIIHDHILVACELIISFKLKKGNFGWVMIKLDFSKAYDKLYWSFIIKVYNTFGFSKGGVK